jgi:hypothetical protein
MPAHSALLSFTGGEMSPYLLHRTDFEKHGSGAEIMENFLPLPYGGFRKRPGLQWIDDLAAATRLEPFEFSTATKYLLAFTTTGLTVFGEDGSIKDTVAYAFGDPFALRFAHVNDVLWIASPNHFPQQLNRVADTNWTIADIAFTYPPLLDENLDEDVELGLQPSGSTANWANLTAYTVGTHVNAASGRDYTCITAHTSAAADDEPGVGTEWATKWRVRYIPAGTTGLLSCSPSDDLFQSADAIGTIYRLRHERPLDEFEVELTLTAATDGDYSGSLVIQGGWSIISYGDWDGTVTLQLSFDGGTTWEDRRTWTSSKNRNFSGEGEEPRRCLARLLWTHDSLASVNNPRAVLSASSAWIESLVRIDSFTVPFTTATVTALTDAEIGTTDLWTEGAFSPRRGYPCAIAVHERRLVLAGTEGDPVALWLSKSDDLTDFEQTTLDDGGIFRTLASTRQDPIRWLASARRLIIGTAGAEWVIGSETSDEPLTPANFSAREWTHYGSAALPALRLNDAVYFIERQGRRLREMAYLLERESYDAADLTRLAEHITGSGIIQMAYQGNREPTLWCVRSDGQLAAFTYIRTERITCWSRHTTTGGTFESIAVLRGESSGDDTVWTVVNRSGTRHLERMPAAQQAEQEDGDMVDCFHLDSAVKAAATDGSLQIDTPAHLNSVQLSVFADGYESTGTPAAGKLTLAQAHTVVHAGLPVVSRFIPLAIDLVVQDGATHGRKKKIVSLNLSLFRSRAGTILIDGQERLVDYETTSDLTTPPPLVTDWIATTLPGHGLRTLQFEIRHTSPHPFTVRAGNMEWTLTQT